MGNIEIPSVIMYISSSLRSQCCKMRLFEGFFNHCAFLQLSFCILSMQKEPGKKLVASCKITKKTSNSLK